MLGEVRLVGRLEAGPAGQGERGDRRPVIGLGRRDDPPAVGLAALDVVAPREPKGRLVGLGAARDEVDAGEAGWRERGQAVRKELLRVGGELLVVEERDPGGLRASRLDDLRHTVPDRRDHGTASDCVEERVALAVVEPDALGPVDERVRAIELTRENMRLVGPDDDRFAHRPTSGL